MHDWPHTTTAAPDVAGRGRLRQTEPARRPEPSPEYGGLYPRWPLLAAALLTPLVLLAYGLEVLFQHRACPFGAVCHLDEAAAPLQVGLIWLLFLLVWMFCYAGGISGGLEDRADNAHWLRRATDFLSVRWLVVGLGGVALVGLVAVIWRHTVTPPAFALSTILIFVAVCHLLYHDRTQPQAADDQAQHQRNLARASRFLAVLATLPLIRWIALSRARRRNPANGTPPNR